MLAIGCVCHTWQNQKYHIAFYFHGAKFLRNHNQLYYRKFSRVKFHGKQGLCLALSLFSFFKNDTSNVQISTKESATVIDPPLLPIPFPALSNMILLQMSICCCIVACYREVECIPSGGNDSVAPGFSCTARTYMYLSRGFQYCLHEQIINESHLPPKIGLSFCISSL